jgi:predicted DNA-binding transcriptional regulator YafY
MARNEQLIRQHKILQILERVRYGRTLQEIQQDLVDELGLSSLHQRTVRRDLEALQAAGIDVMVQEEKRGKIWKLGPRAKTATRVTCSATELIALSLGRQLMHPLEGTPFWIGIETFWNKVQEVLPEPVLTHYEKYRKILRVQGLKSKNYDKKLGIIKTINRSILEHRTLEIVYQSMGKEPKTRCIEPYEMCLHKSSLYVIGVASEVEDPETRVRVWKLDRFEKAKLLEVWFKPPKDLDLENFFGNALTIFHGSGEPRDFVIKIAARHGLAVAEDPWHPDQVVEPIDDDFIQLTVPNVTHEMEIMPHVMALGHEAEVLLPPDIRQSMTKVAKKMVKLYQA